MVMFVLLNHKKNKIMEIKKDKYYIIRTHSAGVFFGNIKEFNAAYNGVTFANFRRLFYWSGAASLSQLALEGTKKPNDCKFTVTITDDDGIYIPQVIEIIPCTKEAVENIKSVREWKI